MSKSSICLVVFLAIADALAGTYMATNGNQSTVNAVTNGPTHTAVDGDVINIPAARYVIVEY